MGLFERTQHDVQERMRDRVRGEFVEMPGLILTAPQAQRLWRLDPGECECILESLVAEGFLQSTNRGYLRRM